MRNWQVAQGKEIGRLFDKGSWTATCPSCNAAIRFRPQKTDLGASSVGGRGDVGNGSTKTRRSALTGRAMGEEASSRRDRMRKRNIPTRMGEEVARMGTTQKGPAKPTKKSPKKK